MDCKVGGKATSVSLKSLVTRLMVDPAWANPIKELVKTRAKEQQARAIAQVVEATARSRMLGKGNFPYVLHPVGSEALARIPELFRYPD